MLSARQIGQSIFFRNMTVRDGFTNSAATEMTGATICAPNIKVITGINKVAAPTGSDSTKKPGN